MDTFEAANFKGKYPGKGVKKMVEVEDLPDDGNSPEFYICNMCGKQETTGKKLFEHLKAHRPEDEKEEVVGEVKPIKRGRGRPPKKEVITNDTSADTCEYPSAS